MNMTPEIMRRLEQDLAVFVARLNVEAEVRRVVCLVNANAGRIARLEAKAAAHG